MYRYCVLLLAALSQSVWSSPNLQQPINTNSLAHAFMTGKDVDGKLLFLCLGKIFNSVQPGKTWNGYGRCNVPYGGKEYIVDDFLIPHSDFFKQTTWKYDSTNAIQVGTDSNNSPINICQTYFKGSKQPGKTWPGYNHCNISYDGLEIISDDFRVLVINKVNQSLYKQPHLFRNFRKL